MKIMGEQIYGGQEFLEAWKRAICLTGRPELFYSDEHEANSPCKSKEDVEKATDKNHLRPDKEAFERAFGVCSASEISFLLSMYSFFNGDDAKNIAINLDIYRFPFPGVLAHQLDTDRKQVLFDLMLSYRGW